MRVLFQIGPVTIYWYSFLMLVSILVGYEISIHYSRRIHYHESNIVDMIFWLVVWSIVGARVYYVIFNFSAFRDNLIGIFQIWRGGLAIYGGIIAGVVYIFYYSIRNKLNFVKILDIYSLSLLLGQAIGRWGNFFNGEAYGGITTYEALSSLHLPKFIIDGMYIDDAYRQPTFLYESIWCIIGVVILYFIRRKPFQVTGKQTCFYLFWYGFGRFFIEGLRSDSLYFLNFRVSQVFSLIICIVGFGGLCYFYFSNHKKIRSVNNIDGRI